MMQKEQASRDSSGRRLRVIALSRLALFVSAGALALFIFYRTHEGNLWSYSTRFLLGITCIAVLSSLVQFWASYRPLRGPSISLVLVTVDQALFSMIAYLTGGVASGATSLLGVGCLVGGMLWGLPGALLAVATGAIFFTLNLLIVLGAPDLLPPDQPLAMYALGEGETVFYFVFTILMLLLVGLLTGYLAERLSRAGGQVEAAERRAEQAERLAVLGRVAAGLAHEIRNPLGSISGAVQMLRTSSEREEDRELCDIVLRESSRLEDLVSDMMNLSQHRPLDWESVDAAQVCRDVMLLAKRAGRGSEDVGIEYDGPESCLLRADGARLRQLAWNLVRNAIQASAPGDRVRLVLDAGSAQTSLTVEDEGEGIDSEARDRLFDAFYTTRSKGTGIGLAVVKRIADEHGFLLKVESNQGSGTRFVLFLGPSISPTPAAAHAAGGGSETEWASRAEEPSNRGQDGNFSVSEGTRPASRP